MSDRDDAANKSLPAATQACPGPPHEKPEDRDYPCWGCRLDAYFAYLEVTS